ncbi:MAG TPA: hypothetical protein GXX25_06985 [Desulfotomaculum sp.]|nr:hypothetical protein [Desulfotomaculum sp.]
MKIKKWMAVVSAAGLFSGMLLAGLPAGKAMAAGDPPARAGKYNMQVTRPNTTGAGTMAGVALGRTAGTMNASVAQFLGMDVSALITARHSGKSLVEIAAEKGISEQQLINFIVSQQSSQIDQLFRNGKITQAQADQCKQIMAEQIKANVSRTTVGPNRSGSAGRNAGRGA